MPPALVVFCLLVFFRDPAFFINPRIWAEEGSIYIQSYLDSGPIISFFSPHLGYYSFFNNIAVGLSMSALGLEFVAAGTTTFSLVIMSLALLSPLVLPSHYWNTERKNNYYFVFGSSWRWTNMVEYN